MKKKLGCFLLAVLLILSPITVLADAVVGDTIVVLGADLTDEERGQMLQQFKASDQAQIVEVTNAEEHQYLDGVIPQAQIGSIAISSVSITYTSKDSGLNVKVSKNINYISKDTYTNALMTAGVKDADIIVSSPFEVSGTAALTGIMKAYEISTGEPISDEVKKVANEEMITTQELADEIGDEKASDVINAIKKEIAEKKPQTTEEIQNIINNINNNYNINLTPEQSQQLLNLFDKMKDANINWDELSNQLQKYSDKAGAFLASPEGKSFLQNIKDVFSAFIDWISSLF
ncbi:MAG: DUF1002 domain-containing protein [Eubacteriaceae bacterium]|jgi:uncharacterized protein YpuA (DUF1002 family)|nr:DUF1002 domain-containing protein [Eubacteriaceae bacterium]